jgi:hypothetical protein
LTLLRLCFHDYTLPRNDKIRLSLGHMLLLGTHTLPDLGGLIFSPVISSDELVVLMACHVELAKDGTTREGGGIAWIYTGGRLRAEPKTS